MLELRCTSGQSNAILTLYSFYARTDTADGDESEQQTTVIPATVHKNKKPKTEHLYEPPLLCSDGEEEIISWAPLRLTSVWKDSEMTEHVFVALVLPSGVASKNVDNIDVSVDSSGTELLIKVRWPRFVCEVESLHKVWTRSMSYSAGNENRELLSRINAFSETLATMRKNEQEILTSTAKIPLPIQVSKKPNFVKLLGDLEGDTRVLYVDLKAEESTYKANLSANVEF